MECCKSIAILIAFIGVTFGSSAENRRIQVVTAPYDSPLVSPHLIKAIIRLKQIDPEKHTEFACRTCEQVVDGVLSLRRSNATREVMVDYLTRLCNLYTDRVTEACTGRVDIVIDTVIYIIDNKEDLKPARFCAIYFQTYECEDPDADSWSIPLPAFPSKVIGPKNIKNDSGSLQILHVTDVHLDGLYTAGSNSKCSEPLCCESGTPATPDDAAGYWGDYDVCDMPWYTMEDMLNRIKEQQKILDWIYFTGDIISHRSWATTVQSNTDTTKLFYALLAKTFPDKTIFPILGNHEPHPTDFYSPDGVDKNSNVSTQWVLDLAADEWSRWLPNATQTTIKRGGYYTVLVKPGFRIVALNSNVCYTVNLWLIYENKDTFGQLQWLVDVLTQAEKDGEKVHILSHIPPSDMDASCVKIWSREFTKIVLRFADTITAQFNGHTHTDEFKLFYNQSNPEEVKGVGYNGASFTTFVGCNPNYRVYDVDNGNMTVTDYHQYIFNLTKANSNAPSSPEWYELYSFKKAYGLPDLTLKSLGELYVKMTSNGSDNALVEQYFKYMYQDSDVFNRQGCDSACKKKLVCLIATVETTDSIDRC